MPLPFSTVKRTSVGVLLEACIPARIAVVAGDGIGTEVTAQARKVIEAVLPDAEFDDYDLGARFYNRTHEVLPQAIEDELAAHDAILLGAIGDPSVPPGVLERGLLLKLRFDFDQYVNLRPMRLLPGVAGPLAGREPQDVDMICVRENSEGEYSGFGGRLLAGTPHEVPGLTVTRPGLEDVYLSLVGAVPTTSEETR